MNQYPKGTGIPVSTQVTGPPAGDLYVDTRERQLFRDIYQQKPRNHSVIANWFLRAVRKNTVEGPKPEVPVQRHIPAQGELTGAYTNTGLDAKCGADVKAAAVVYLVPETSMIKHCIPGKRLHIENESGYWVQVECTERRADSVKCTVLAEDLNNVLQMGDGWGPAYTIMGNARPMGSALPGTVMEEPTERYNVTQTIMEALEITGGERAYKSHWTKSVFTRQFEQMTDRFQTSLMGTLMFSQRDVASTGDSAYWIDDPTTMKATPKPAMGGILWWLTTYGPKHPELVDEVGAALPANIVDLATITYIGENDGDDANFAGNPWIENCPRFFRQAGMHLSKWTDERRFRFFAGRQAINDITTAFEEGSLKVRTEDYLDTDIGFNVKLIKGLDFEFEMIEDSFFSLQKYGRSGGLIVPSGILEFCPVRDRDLWYIDGDASALKKAMVDSGKGHLWRDGMTSGMCMEGTLMCYNPDAMMIVRRIGAQNTAR